MPHTFPYAHIVGKDWQSICDKLITTLGDSSHFGDLAFIYMSDQLAGNTDRILDYLREKTGITHWSGSVGLGICSTGKEVYDEASIAVLVTDFADDSFRVLETFKGSPTETLAEHKDWRERNMASVALVHSDPASVDLPQHLEEFADGLQGGFLLGGVTSANDLQVQIADKATGGGVSGVLFSASINITSGLSQGCTLIGEKHRVTESEHNLVSTLDGENALDVMKNDIGPELSADLHQLGGIIYVALPVASSDTGDYTVRNLLGIDPDHGVLAIGDLVAQESQLQFARRDAESAVTDMHQMLEGLKKRLPGPVKGALYHTCLGRGRNLFGDDSEELKLIQEYLGDVPLVGFYANGEISHRRLYGYTGVLTVFC